jgi:hypothetical protein
LKRQILFHGFLASEKVPAPPRAVGWCVVEGPNTETAIFGEDPVGTEGGGWNFDALPNGIRMAKQQHAYYLFIIISKSFSSEAHSIQSGARASSQLPRAQLSKRRRGPLAAATAATSFNLINFSINYAINGEDLLSTSVEFATTLIMCLMPSCKITYFSMLNSILFFGF